MFSRIVLLLAACLVPLTCRSEAIVAKSPEEATAGAIAEWTRMCTEISGQVPGSWGEYRSILKVSVDEVFGNTLPTKRYAILPEPMPLTAPLDGQLLAMNRDPIYDVVPSGGFLGMGAGLKGPGRYLIYRTAAGKFSYAWITEDYVKTTFARAKTPLPDSDGEPEREWVIQARAGWMKIMWAAGSVALVVLLSAVILRRRPVKGVAPQAT
jgi:hypothetical protein